MSLPIGRPSRIALRHELQALRGNWVWFLLLGIALIVLGVIAIEEAFVATLVAVITYGMLLIVGGLLQFVGAFWARDWSGFFLELLTALLYFVVGILTVRRPAEMSEVLTILIAAFFFVSGVFRIVGALALPLANWAWALLSGILNVVMGLIIWAQLPFSGYWVIGLFLGIELIFTGVWWSMIALAVRRFPAPPSGAGG